MMNKYYKDNSMPQNITKGYKALLAEANKVVTAISVAEARELVDSENHTFIDIRDFRELKREGKVPGAHSCPRGMLEFWVDPDSPYHKELFSQDKTFVLYCASSWRSALAAKSLMEMGMNSIVHIDGGFGKWKKDGGPVEELD
jgi:rhodanese-related sulfurtransferase